MNDNIKEYMKNKVVVDKSYDFDRLYAYEVQQIEGDTDETITITLYKHNLVGVMRHAVKEGEKESEDMVQIIDGKPVSLLRTKDLLFTFKKLKEK